MLWLLCCCSTFSFLSLQPFPSDLTCEKWLKAALWKFLATCMVEKCLFINMVRCTSLGVTHCLIDSGFHNFFALWTLNWRFRARSPNPQVKSYHKAKVWKSWNGKSETVINNCSLTSRLISHQSPDSSCRFKRNTRLHRDGGDTSVGILNEDVSYSFVRVCVSVSVCAPVDG